MAIEFNGNINFSKQDAKKTNLNDSDNGALKRLALNNEIIKELKKKTPQGEVEFKQDLWQKTIDPADAKKLIESLTESRLEGLPGISTQEVLTPEQKKARAELDKKVSSTGISYAEANKTIDEIRKKYTDDKYFTEKTVESEQPENILIYIPPKKTKEFDPSKLPEPDRTQYKEAVEAKYEIENNNDALVKKAGIKKSKLPEFLTVDLSKIKKAITGLTETVEPTEKEKAARAKLDEKVSSTGVKYKDAKAQLEKLQKQYEASCRSKFESKQPENITVYIAPYEGFDPYKIPEPDKTAYFEALACVMEIEKSNSALVAQAGIEASEMPDNPALQQSKILY